MAGPNDHFSASDSGYASRATGPQDRRPLPPRADASAEPPPPNWSLQDPELRERWLNGETPQEIADALSRSTGAIMTRAARLGLPRRFSRGRKPGQRNSVSVARRDPEREPLEAPVPVEAIAATPAARFCLMCMAHFQSVGRHNRICPKCKESPEYLAGCRISDTQFQV